MARNNASTTDAPNAHRLAETEMIVVDPDDVVQQLINARRDEYNNERRQRVLRVSPPFGDEVRATPHTTQEGNYYPPDMDPKPVHFGPKMFVGHESGSGRAPTTDIQIPTYSESRRLARDDHGDDVDEETIDEYHETAMEIWEGRVRAALLDEITVGAEYPERPSTTVSVRYEASDE